MLLSDKAQGQVMFRQFDRAKRLRGYFYSDRAMKIIWRRVLRSLLAIVTCAFCIVIPSMVAPVYSEAAITQGLSLEKAGTSKVYFAQDGEPLLSFGGLSDFIFYAAPDAFDYKLWADWAAAHGMNHLRAYPPFSWRDIEAFAEENGGKADSLLFPYEETSPGSRQFDLTRFSPAYWQRFRDQCEYLQSKGIVIHLLMINGWQLLPEPENWGGHFFNPDNNINEFTDHLAGDRLGFYKSVSDRQTDLVAAQKAWLAKVVEETADLDNVYYDLVHEIAENYQDWSKAKDWIETMAQTVRDKFSELQPDRSIILGMDTGGLERRQREWIFSRSYFDVLVFGKSHQVSQALEWRIRYKKPYIPQEMWDEDGTKYGFREPATRVHLRKYLWKFMMAKCQQMDAYIKPRVDEQMPGFPHNYDPNGWNPVEDDAVILRDFWNRLRDYPNLWFDGQVQAGPGENRYVLSSSQEGLVYLSSDTGKVQVSYDAQDLHLKDLALQNGSYAAEIVKPDQGIVSTLSIAVDDRRTALPLPPFIDDLAIHIFREGEPTAQRLEDSSNSAENPGAVEAPSDNLRNALKWILSGVAIAVAVLLGLFYVSNRKRASER